MQPAEGCRYRDLEHAGDQRRAPLYEFLGIVHRGEDRGDLFIEARADFRFANRRVVRCSRRTPSLFSSFWTRLDTTAGDIPSSRPAADMLPALTT